MFRIGIVQRKTNTRCAAIFFFCRCFYFGPKMDSDDEPYGMDELNDEQRAALNELVTYARQLNICEDVTVDGDVFEIREDGTRVLKPKPPSESECKQKYYKYLIVIDFEATCWENKRKPKNEIIGENIAHVSRRSHPINDPFFIRRISGGARGRECWSHCVRVPPVCGAHRRAAA